MLSADSELELVVTGQACVLLDDPEKSFDVSEGHLLVPWGGDSALLIDRYDCRAHLTDLNEFESPVSLEPEDYLSEDDLTLEKMCEFERYLDLRVDVDEVVTQSEEEKKRESEKLRSQYGAVGFSYDEESGNLDAPEHEGSSDSGASRRPTSPEAPYVIPPELAIPEGVEIPATDKQAQIIERTAVFVARQGNQMEIILKTKQTNNPLFSFLNYDHNLNAFYKEVVKLIRSGRYIPKARPPKVEPDAEIKFTPNKSIHEDVYELKLPKVDISNTAYASLINKFKKVNESALTAANAQYQSSPATDPEPCSTEEQSAMNAMHTNESPVQDGMHTSDNVVAVISKPPVIHVPTPSGAHIDATVTTSANTTLTEEYEQCYQEYYKHYYAHYYTQFSEQQAKVLNQSWSSFSEDQRSSIVHQAAKAAAVAASAAVNAMYQAGLKQKSETNLNPTPAMTASERGIIDKMAEYVMRNGPEFEELVTRQKGDDPRFGFLKPGHPLHTYYQSRKQSTIDEHSQREKDKIPLSVSSPGLNATDDRMEHRQDEQSADHTFEKDLPKERQSSISFRLTRPNSSGKIRATTPERTVPQSTMACTTQPTNVHAAASFPVLPKQDCHLHSPQTPANSLASTENLPNGRSPSPVKFSLPGIPFASDTSSAESSPRSKPCSETRTSDKSSCSPVGSLSHAPDAISDTSCKLPSRNSPPSDEIVREQSSSFVSQTNRHCSPKKHKPISHSPQSTKINNQSPSPHKSWGSNAIEELLGLVDDRMPKNRSPDPSSLHHAAQKVLDERLREERRKRAAQLVARLKSCASPDSHPIGFDSSSAQFTHKSAPSSAPPPPPPDSVPAAVAHAVVASLKRRQEETRALEAEAKARKRTRSPPAAYALPKERPHKSSKHSRRPRDASSPDNSSRIRDVSREQSYSRRSKHKKSRH